MDDVIVGWLLDFFAQYLWKHFKEKERTDNDFLHRDLLQGLLLLPVPQNESSVALESDIIMLLCYLEDGSTSAIRYNDDPSSPTALENAIQVVSNMDDEFLTQDRMLHFFRVAREQAIYVCCRENNFADAQKVLDRFSQSGQSDSPEMKEQLKSLQMVVDSADPQNQVLNDHPYFELEQATVFLLDDFMSGLSAPFLVESARNAASCMSWEQTKAVLQQVQGSCFCPQPLSASPSNASESLSKPVSTSAPPEASHEDNSRGLSNSAMVYRIPHKKKLAEIAAQLLPDKQNPIPNLDKDSTLEKKLSSVRKRRGMYMNRLGDFGVKYLVDASVAKKAKGKNSGRMPTVALFSKKKRSTTQKKTSLNRTKPREDEGSDEEDTLPTLRERLCVKDIKPEVKLGKNNYGRIFSMEDDVNLFKATRKHLMGGKKCVLWHQVLAECPQLSRFEPTQLRNRWQYIRYGQKEFYSQLEEKYGRIGIVRK